MKHCEPARISVYLYKMCTKLCTNLYKSVRFCMNVVWLCITFCLSVLFGTKGTHWHFHAPLFFLCLNHRYKNQPFLIFLICLHDCITMVCIGVFCGVVGASWSGASGATSGSFIFYRPTSTELIQKRCRPSVSSTRLVAGIWFSLIFSERLSSTWERQECTSSGRSWNESELREEKADHYFFLHHLNL